VALAKDVMTPHPIVLESSTLISDAVAKFAEKKISSVPVMTTMGEVAGQLTELVMVRALVLNQLQPEKYKQLHHCTELLEPALFVSPQATITEVIKALMKSPSRRVLVRADGRQIMGIISPKDLLRVLMNGQEVSASVKAEIGKLGVSKVDADKI
jgi:CBS domain-containing protein